MTQKKTLVKNWKKFLLDNFFFIILLFMSLLALMAINNPDKFMRTVSRSELSNVKNSETTPANVKDYNEECLAELQRENLDDSELSLAPTETTTIVKNTNIHYLSQPDSSDFLGYHCV